MYRMVFAGGCLQEHLETMEHSPERYRPERCPQCGMARLWRHGSYLRKADRRRQSDFNPVPIPRFKCRDRECGGTCSRLPECIAPRRWYSWLVQQWVLQWLQGGGSVRAGAFWSGVARRTVRRWRDWLGACGDRFALFLRSRFPELGRAGDGAAFWQGCLERMPLSLAMAWLDHDGVRVP